ncbi:hypothetical protein [Microbacterium sp. A93]|uniref:hypothetical protein n=1 Tax=Microbacterium sp. A93 TaxID=3450716 RepID=UPI003F42023F
MTRIASPPDQVRSLPIAVRPLAGETVTGYLARLANANALTPRLLRLHVTDIAGISPYRPDLERAAPWAERLGGLPAGHFARDIQRNSMYVRCHHHGWAPYQCRNCGYTQPARAACRRCAQGEETTVHRRGGAVCNRHRRWHIEGGDHDLTAFPEYLHAERCLSGTLWKRGIGLSTGELQLAAVLVGHWTIDTVLNDRLRARMTSFGIGAVDQDTALLVAYPEIVSLTTVLTDPSFASYLLTPRFSTAQQVWALEAAVVTIMHGSTTQRLHEVAQQIVARGKAAVETAYGMRQRATNKRPAALEKALIASSDRHRACLLRHLSTVRIQVLPYEPGVAAPRTRVLDRRRPQPDPAISG